MGSLATTYTFVTGNTASASEVNTNFSDVVNYINARNAGSTYWDALAVTGNATILGNLTVAGTDVVSLLTSDGWLTAGETWTYASATTFTISGDKTGKYSKGDKIKFAQSGQKYFYIIGVSYSAPNTIITVTGGVDYTIANAAIGSPYYSKMSSPNGFPHNFNWTPGYTGFSVNPTIHSATFSIHGGSIHIDYRQSALGTSNSSSFTITGLPFDLGTVDGTTETGRSVMSNSAGSLDVPSLILINGTTVSVYYAVGFPTAWNATGVKGIYGFKESIRLP